MDQGATESEEKEGGGHSFAPPPPFRGGGELVGFPNGKAPAPPAPAGGAGGDMAGCPGVDMMEDGAVVRAGFLLHSFSPAAAAADFVAMLSSAIDKSIEYELMVGVAVQRRRAAQRILGQECGVHSGLR